MYLFSYSHLGILMAHTHTGYRIFAFAFSSYRCGLPWGFSSKESTCQGRRSKRHGFDPWVWKIPWRRSWQLMATHSSILPGESHGQRNLVGYSQKDHKELNMTEATQHIRVCVCVCVPHLYPFICQWTFMLFPCLGYCKQRCDEPWGACMFSNYSFVWVYAQK